MGRLAEAAEILPICGLPKDKDALAEEEQELEAVE